MEKELTKLMGDKEYLYERVSMQYGLIRFIFDNAFGGNDRERFVFCCMALLGYSKREMAKEFGVCNTRIEQIFVKGQHKLKLFIKRYCKDCISML